MRIVLLDHGLSDVSSACRRQGDGVGPDHDRSRLAENRRSDAHHGRAFFDRDLEIVAHAHRQLARASTDRRPAPSSRRAARAAPRNRAARPRDRRRPAAAASARRARGRAAALAPRRRSAAARPRGAPCLVGSPARSTCMSSSSRRPAATGGLVELAAAARAPSIEWTTSNAAAFLALFDCRWPMRCQRSGRSAVCVHLRERLLDFVFAEIDLAGVGGGANVIGGERFGDGDEADGGGIAPGPAGGARDTIADAGQPGAERDGIDHYFLSCARMPFAVAAFGPSARVSDMFRTRLPAPAGCPRSRAPCRADNALRRGSGSPRSRASNCFFASAILPRVPEDDALVVQRVGVAAAAAARAAARRQLASPWRWPPPPGRTCAGAL